MTNATPEARRAGPTLLVVDDDAIIRRALGRALDGEGFRVLLAAGGKEALEILSRDRVDVLLSDQNMPEMNGLDLLRMVRLRHSSVIRMMITSSEDFDVAVRAINLGEVARFIRKPWNDDELIRSVRLAFDQAALEREVRMLRKQAKKTIDALRALEAQYPGIGAIRRDAEGAIEIDPSLLDETDFA